MSFLEFIYFSWYLLSKKKKKTYSWKFQGNGNWKTKKTWRIFWGVFSPFQSKPPIDPYSLLFVCKFWSKMHIIKNFFVMDSFFFFANLSKVSWIGLKPFLFCCNESWFQLILLLLLIPFLWIWTFFACLQKRKKEKCSNSFLLKRTKQNDLATHSILLYCISFFLYFFIYLLLSFFKLFSLNLFYSFFLFIA